ncbi:MAG: Lrp/AsnC family transcriptional regulator [Thermoprotei archaeon]|nr:MAG: Lrp/AsnC family transcriptional regulator [Thermoprotei archaeon]
MSDGEDKVKAYVLLVVTTGREKDVLREVKRIGGVSEASVVYGDYDLIAKVEAPNLRDLNKIVMKIRSLNSVVRSSTLISVD